MTINAEPCTSHTSFRTPNVCTLCMFPLTRACIARFRSALQVMPAGLLLALGVVGLGVNAKGAMDEAALRGRQF